MYMQPVARQLVRKHVFLARPKPGTARWPLWRLFYFYIFRKHFLQKYIFNITFYSFVPLPPGRGRQGLICKFKKKIYLCGSPWREPAAPLPGGRPPAANPPGARGPAARQGGGRLPDCGQLAVAIRCVDVWPLDVF